MGDRKCYIADHLSYVNAIKWDENANKQQDFELVHQKNKRVDEDGKDTIAIFLTPDEKELFVGSIESFFIIDAVTLETIKKFDVAGNPTGFSLIDNNNKV